MKGVPVVIVRGYKLPEGVEPRSRRQSMQRPKQMDVFR
jgi:F420-0:gamma-glutamyl ligase